MTPADKLIVALDVPPDDALDLFTVLRLQTGITNFKIGVSTLLQRDGFDLVTNIRLNRGQVMLDLKLYDVADTVKRTMEIAAKLGATWVTVHVDCVEHVVGFGPKVLAVRRLTDGTGPFLTTENLADDLSWADGLVCTAAQAKRVRMNFETDQILVCPGIRPAGTPSDNHQRPATPREAIEAGADYIVVGRPIYAAAGPVAAARAIIDEIEVAGAQQPG